MSLLKILFYIFLFLVVVILILKDSYEKLLTLLHESSDDAKAIFDLVVVDPFLELSIIHVM